MFKKLANLVTGREARPKADPSMDPKQAALLRAIAEHRKTDPLVGAKIGAQDVFARLLTGLRGEQGVHAETLLATLGALAGYSCQIALRLKSSQTLSASKLALMRIQTEDGRFYYFGDTLNKPLAESKYSVWSLAAAAAQDAGCNPLPDINELFKYVTESLGTPAFGMPRLPATSNLALAPEELLRQLWKPLLSTFAPLCPDPDEWPIMFGLAVQQGIDAAKSAVSPALALTIVMESAIAMSKVDLGDA